MLNTARGLAGWINGTKTGKWLLASVAALPMVAAVPNTAKADGRDFHDDRRDHRDDARRDDRHDDRHDEHGGLRVDFRLGGETPGYEERHVQVWIPPVYRTECDRVWVPDVYEDRQVRFFGRGEWHTRVEHVLVTPGHYEDRDRQVLVTPGHYETRVERTRVVVDHAGPSIGFHLGR